MKIYSWNVNGLRAVESKGKLEELLRVEKPDVVCFQEIKMDEGAAGGFREKYAGFEQFYSFAGKKGYSGTGIWVSKKCVHLGMVDLTGVLDRGELVDEFGDALSEGRLIAVEFEGFYLVNMYAPHTKRELERLPLKRRWNEMILKLLKELEEVKPVVLAGDFNVAHREIDLANPKQNVMNAGFTKEEREDFDKFMEAGLVDTFREFNPEKTEVYTWWTWRAKARERNVGWRIDYFVVSKDFIHRVIGAGVHADVFGSDHCPVSLTIGGVK
ncbi:exodeoxyribonuclease III [Candidatus Saccharibacteria bacterium]|nr:exodeoxyribonuclease III [Candidatus Saccharibacteria bacterium]